MPALVKKVGKPIELIDNPSDKAKVSNYLQLTSKEFDDMVKELKTEMGYVDSVKSLKSGEYLDPFYFPFIKKEQSFGQKLSSVQSARKALDPDFLKGRTGAMFLQNTWEENPLRALAFHTSQVTKLKSAERMFQDIINMPSTMPWMGGKVPSGYKIFDPEGFLRTGKTYLNYTTNTLKATDEIGDLSFGAQIAMQKLVPEIAENATKPLGKTYLVPKAVADSLTQVFPNNVHWGVRAFYDTPMKYWKIAQLQLRSKWHVNNATGGLMMSVMSGADPMSYATALNPKSARLVPKIAQDTTWLGALQLVPPKTPLGKFTTWSTRISMEVDDYYRRVVAISEEKKMLGEVRKGKLKELVKGIAISENENVALRQLAHNPKTIERIVNKVNDFLPNFHGMSEFEKTFVRRVVPFYGFIKHQVMMDAKLIYKYPKRSIFMKNLENAAGEMLPEDVKRNFKEGKVYMGEDVTYPYGKDGAAVPVKRYLDTRYMSPFIPGGPLSVLTPMLSTAIEYFTNRSLFTGKTIEDPMAIELSGGKWAVLNATGDDFIIKDHPVGPVKYTVMKNLAVTNLLKKGFESKYPNKSANILSVYKHKEMPEEIMNFLFMNTYLENPQLEKMRENETKARNINTVLNSPLHKPQLMEKFKQNKGLMKRAVEKVKDTTSSLPLLMQDKYHGGFGGPAGESRNPIV
jgi:hypothetical protein